MSIAETFSSAGSLLARWYRRHLTAEALLDAAKTSVWVVPLTILVWVYAEQQQHLPVQDQTLQVDFRASTPDRIVTLANRRDDMIMVDLDGSNAAVSAVKEEINRRG